MSGWGATSCVEATVRIVLVAAVIAAGTLLDMPASQAYEGPWCAVSNIGHDVTWNCSMRSLEMCVQEVVAGNRGFCNPNPRWQGNPSGAGYGRSRRNPYGY